MARKKRKSVTEKLLTADTKRALKESVNELSHADEKPDKEHGRIKYRASAKAVAKKAAKSVKFSNPKSSKSAYQSAMTGTARKALKEAAKEPFRVADEKRKQLNKEYRKQRSLLIRRINNFEKNGYKFADTLVPPVLEGNATQEEIDYMKSLRKQVLRNMAVSFTPQAPAHSEEPDEPIITEPDEPDEEDWATGDPDEEEIDDWTMSDEEHDRIKKFPPVSDEEDDPQARYYRDNPDREIDYEEAVEEGRLILENIYADLEQNQASFLGSRLDDDSSIVYIKQDAAARIAAMLQEALHLMGEKALCIVLEENATAVKHAVTNALYFFDSKDESKTAEVTSSALTELSSILFQESPSTLMNENFGAPDNL